MAAARKAALEAKLQQIQELLKGAPATPVETAFPCATGPSDQCLVKFSDREIKVVIGTSEHIQQPLVDQICHIVDAAYSKVGKHKRVDRYDAVDRGSSTYEQLSIVQVQFATLARLGHIYWQGCGLWCFCISRVFVLRLGDGRCRPASESCFAPRVPGRSSGGMRQLYL